MKFLKIVMGVMVCAAIVHAQEEEVPATRSNNAEVPQFESESALDSSSPSGDPVSTGRRDLTKEETEQMRSFLTVNSIIIIIVILIGVLALFLIINRARRGRRS